MTVFQYKAFNQQGKKISGIIEAQTLNEAKQKVRELNVLIVHIETQSPNKKRAKLSSESLIVFTTQLYQLLSSKIPLFESLLALEEQTRGESYNPVISGITERIRSGASLSHAMQDFPESFPPLYCGMIAAGEAVGGLETALLRLSEFLTRQNKIKKQILSAMIYPAMLSCLMVVAIAILVFFVIPALESLFEDREVPQFTRIVLAVSHLIQKYYLFIIAFGAGLLAFIHIQWKKPRVKEKVHHLLLKIPFARKYVTLTSLARFSRTLSTLLEGGLPLTHAMDFAKASLHNARMITIMDKVSQTMVAGIPLSQELSKYSEIPPLFIRMIHIGEESGTLAAMLQQSATLYEDDIERMLNRMLTLLQPALLLFMGVVIGTVLLSILLPMSDFGSSLSM